MCSRRTVTIPANPSPQVQRNVEDSQPNEARGLPKGAGIPTVIHAIPEPSRHRQRLHNGWDSSDINWRKRKDKWRKGNWTPTAAETRVAVPSPVQQTSHPGGNVPTSTTGEKPIPRPEHPLPSNPTKRPKLGDNTSNSVALNKAPAKKRRKKKPRNLKYDSQKHSTLLEWLADAPDNCKEGAPNSKTSRRKFVADFIPGFASTMGAVIKEHTWRDAQLVVIYTIDTIESETEDSKPKNPESDIKKDDFLNENLKIPSGSNVKLEDQTICAGMESNPQCAEEVIEVEKLDEADQPFHPEQRRLLPLYRPFRSGTLSLTHGPPRTLCTDLPSPIKMPFNRGAAELSVNSEAPDAIDLSSPALSVEDGNEMPDIEDEVEPISLDEDDILFPLQVRRANDGQEDKGDNGSLQLTGEGDFISLPRYNRDKPRRILVSEAQNMIYVLTLHGRVHEITRSLPREQGEILAFESAGTKGGIVDDACLLSSPFDYMSVLGQTSEDDALTLVDFSENVDQRISKLPRTSLQQDKLLRGVSAVHALPISSEPRFLTGGYDHTVELWTVEESLSSASSMSLAIQHHSVVNSFTTVKDSSLKVISAGADCCVNVWDFASERTINSVRTSNMVYHVHPTVSPGCILFEVAHRDLQFELHDYRVDIGRPLQRFGFLSSAVNGRYMKGDIRGNIFVSGDRNGFIRLWDLRNPTSVLQTVECFPGHKIVQAVFDNDRLYIVSEDNRLVFLNIKDGE